MILRLERDGKKLIRRKRGPISITNLLAQSANVPAVIVVSQRSLFCCFSNKTMPNFTSKQLEVAPNFYALCSMPYASKICVNLQTERAKTNFSTKSKNMFHYEGNLAIFRPVQYFTKKF